MKTERLVDGDREYVTFKVPKDGLEIHGAGSTSDPVTYWQFGFENVEAVRRLQGLLAVTAARLARENDRVDGFVGRSVA